MKKWLKLGLSIIAVLGGFRAYRQAAYEYIPIVSAAARASMTMAGGECSGLGLPLNYLNGTDSFGSSHQNACINQISGQLIFPNLSSLTVSGLTIQNPGNITAGSINGVPSCPTNQGSWSQNVNLGLSAVPFFSSQELDCRNLGGVQTFPTDVNFISPVLLRVAGSLHTTGTGRMIQPQSVIGVSIAGPDSLPAGTTNGPEFSYTGSDCFLKIGSALGLLNAKDVFKNIFIDVTPGTGRGVCVFRTEFIRFQNTTIIGTDTNPFCAIFDGTGGFNADILVEFPTWVGCHITAQFIGPASGNDAVWFAFGTLQASGKTNVGSMPLDWEAGDSLSVYGTDMEAGDICFKLGAAAVRVTIPFMRMEGATCNTHFTILNGAAWNTINVVFQGNSPPVVSNAGGVTNVINLNGNYGGDGSGNNWNWTNGQDASMIINLNAGLTVNQNAILNFRDRNQSNQGAVLQTSALTMEMCTNNTTTCQFQAFAAGAATVTSASGQAVNISPGTLANVNNGLVSTGSAAALTGTGACLTITTQSGGSWGGTAKCTGATAASTLTINPGQNAPNGWVCDAFDQTTRANLFQQTSFAPASCTLTATSITQNDVFVFRATAF